MNEYKLRVTYFYIGENKPYFYEKKIKSFMKLTKDDAVLIATSQDFVFVNLMNGMGKKEGNIKISGIRLYEIIYSEIE